MLNAFKHNEIKEERKPTCLYFTICLKNKKAMTATSGWTKAKFIKVLNNLQFHQVCMPYLLLSTQT